MAVLFIVVSLALSALTLGCPRAEYSQRVELSADPSTDPTSLEFWEDQQFEAFDIDDYETDDVD